MKTITLEDLQLKRLIGSDSFKLVNAHDPSLFELMHIPGSINVCEGMNVRELLEKDDDIVVYCTNNLCYRSRNLYQKLEHMGYRNLCHYAGGLVEWEGKGLPLEGTKLLREAVSECI